MFSKKPFFPSLILNHKRKLGNGKFLNYSQYCPENLIHRRGIKKWGYVDNVDKSVDILKIAVDKERRDFRVCISLSRLFTREKT